jgi:plasmid stabilization system protein ParE
MAYQVVWSPRAIEDVDAIAGFIARDSPAYASIVVDKILQATRSLENFPLSGRTYQSLEMNRYEKRLCTAIALFIGLTMHKLRSQPSFMENGFSNHLSFSRLPSFFVHE